MSHNAIEVINYLGQQSNPSSLSDIREVCKIAPTTLTRLLGSLQDDGYIEKVSHGNYRLCHGRLSSIRGHSRRSHVVLAISPGTHQETVDAIQRTLAENDFSLSLRYIQEYSIKHINDIFRMERQRPDYMVTFFEKSIPEKVLTWLENENIQLINSGYYGHLCVPTISSDFSAGGEQLCQHLIDHGHRNILYIGRKALVEDNINFRARLEGYQRIITRQHLQEHTWLQEYNELSQTENDAVTKTKMQRLAISAIICETPELLRDLVASLQRVQLRIPEDISLASFNGPDDHAFTQLLGREICHVQEPWDEFGKAVAMLIQSQERFRDQRGHHAPRTLSLVPMPFFPGNSIADLRPQ